MLYGEWEWVGRQGLKQSDWVRDTAAVLRGAGSLNQGAAGSLDRLNMGNDKTKKA